MSELATGGCLCGDFSYAFPREAAISTIHCHCQDCRKSTGSGKATIIMVPKAAVTSSGELKTFTVQGTEGAHVVRGFCPKCGSQLMSFVEEMPEVTLVKAGSLNDATWVKADVSCWTHSAQSWSPADANLPAFEKNPILTT